MTCQFAWKLLSGRLTDRGARWLMIRHQLLRGQSSAAEVVHLCPSHPPRSWHRQWLARLYVALSGERRPAPRRINCWSLTTHVASARSARDRSAAENAALLSRHLVKRYVSGRLKVTIFYLFFMPLSVKDQGLKIKFKNTYKSWKS